MVGDCNTGYFRRVAGANCTDLSDQYNTVSGVWDPRKKLLEGGTVALHAS